MVVGMIRQLTALAGCSTSVLSPWTATLIGEIDRELEWGWRVIESDGLKDGEAGRDGGWYALRRSLRKCTAETGEWTASVSLDSYRPVE